MDESECARGSMRESVPYNVMCPPFYSLRGAHKRKLSPDRRVQEYGNKNIVHGTISVVLQKEIFFWSSCGFLDQPLLRRSSLGRRTDFLTSISFALSFQRMGEGSSMGCNVEWHTDVRRSCKPQNGTSETLINHELILT